MSQPQDDLVARASDPNAELTTLHELANNYPGLRPYIAENPRTYPALLEWLGSLGDPAVDAALARRHAAATTQALSLEQAQAAMQAAANESGAAAQVGGQAPQTRPGAPTQAISQPEVTRAVTPERRPIMEGRQAARDAAAPTAAFAYQQPPQQAVYQPQPQQPAYAQPAYQQPQPTYQQAQPAYQQAQPTNQQPQAGDQGVFGVGTPEAEEQRGSSNRWLWVLAAVALVLVVALVVWFFSSNHGGEDPAPITSTTQAAAPQEPATTPTQAEETPSSTPSPSPTASQNLTAPAPADAIEMAAFTTPSGNISCVLGDDSVSCTINDHDFVPTDSSCNDSNAQAFTVSVGTDDEAEGGCGISFSAAGASLNYGASAKNDTFACTSTEAGIECWSQVSGNGFRMSRSEAETTSR
ncbi:hypothetical protein DRB06_01120 [Actinomyces sp. Z5]|uniref:variant leucine-rich repeat-containing protein n=1 Tax=Actinomyces sp. Z5 TaxID=2250216 RepID=UPI000DCC82A7|nr:hypothetical protein [Actinomyces sp. Z5]RAX24272.1 hypothetical protein DRB06_01120 [Actinomyces sp. Z5]